MSSASFNLRASSLRVGSMRAAKLEEIFTGIGTKSMQNASAYEEPRLSGKRLHEYSFDPRSIH